MTRYLIRKYLDSGVPDGRKRVGILLGAAGIFFDLLLFAVKYAAGMMSGSIAVTADAFNNLADAGAHIVALIAFPLGDVKPSKRFPFGCGRLEYLSGLVVAAAILVVSGRMIVSSVEKILHSAAVESSPAVIGVLLFSIAVKGYMYRYNKVIGGRIDSSGLKSVAVDSVCDCFATAAIILAILIQQATGLNIDGWTGAAVALCILWAGIAAAKDSIVPLLGTSVDDKTLDALYEILEQTRGIRTVDEIAAHDYGPDHKVLTMRLTGTASAQDIAALKTAIAEKLHMGSVVEITRINESLYNRPPNGQE